jgi:flavin reductase (DIM6/NTAB) family NADH-FMN oxidoreductase RutF
VVGEQSYSFETLQATKECVIAVPTVEIAKKVVRVGNLSGRKTDKFAAVGLTALPASGVKAPLVGECYVNLECKVVDTAMVKKYNLFVHKVVKAWINLAVKDVRTIHHHGRGVFEVSGETIKISSKMK